tara:strand:+ start:1227 stop:1457 length:231 start_codon:yes stop_codon:yes gene_type:complete
MEITVLDFFLINILSYIGGLGTGLIICCKNKDSFFVKSRSLDNISSLQHNPSLSHPPILASTPQQENKHPVKITLE